MNETYNSISHARTIIHVDLDCFYAQVEMLNNPLLHQRPLGIQQKNLLVTCNYKAREFGLKKCMPLHEAVKLCPTLVIINGEDLYEYRKVSKKVTEYLHKYSDLVERLGLDENFVDVSHSVVKMGLKDLVGKVFGNGIETCQCGCVERLKAGSNIAQQIRDGLKDELGLTCNAGIAHNKLLAKLTGGVNKPNQQTTVFPSNGAELVAGHEISKIPGIGSATLEVLKNINVSNIDGLRNCDYKTLELAFTPDKARYLLNLSFANDFSPVKPSGKPLSIGLEDSCKLEIKSEIESKFTHLLKRLLVLVTEDGRIPTTIKVTVRKLDSLNISGHRETRQCNITPSLFMLDETTNVIRLKDKSDKKLLLVVMNLFNKLVSNTKSCRITLLGLAFTKFHERLTGKKSVASYFMKDLSVHSVTNIENRAMSPTYNIPTTSQPSTSPLSPETEPLPKKFKSSFLNSGYGSDSDYSSPSKLKVAELRLNSDGEVVCPPNTNQEAFLQLPADIQSELLENWKREGEGDGGKPSKKAKTNTILNYLVKNC